MEDMKQFLDNTEFLEWIKNNIDGATKCFVILGYPDSKGLKLQAAQTGFTYFYEIDGFIHWGADLFGNPENCEDIT